MTNPTDPTTISDDQLTEQQRVEAAQLYVKQLRVVYAHAQSFAVGTISLCAINLVVNLMAGIAGEWQAWWSLWSLLGWSIGLAVHGLVVRVNRPSSSTSAWEQRQIDKVLSR